MTRPWTPERTRLEGELVQAELDLTVARERAARRPVVSGALERLRWAEEKVRHARSQLDVLIRKRPN
jgi:hypothetical protein